MAIKRKGCICNKEPRERQSRTALVTHWFYYQTLLTSCLLIVTVLLSSSLLQGDHYTMRHKVSIWVSKKREGWKHSKLAWTSRTLTLPQPGGTGHKQSSLEDLFFASTLGNTFLPCCRQLTLPGNTQITVASKSRSPGI